MAVIFNVERLEEPLAAALKDLERVPYRGDAAHVYLDGIPFTLAGEPPAVK